MEPVSKTEGGSSNVFLGYKAGYNETVSKKLYLQCTKPVHRLSNVFRDESRGEMFLNIVF
jgi:hypothetical protein